jgi:anti-sigma B factor antagonist
VRQIYVERRDSSLLVGLSGDVGATLARPLRSALETAFQDQGPREVVVDMAAVTRCDAVAWAVLVAATRRLQRLGGGLRLTGVSAPVLGALRSTGLHRLVSYTAPPASGGAETQADGAA